MQSMEVHLVTIHMFLEQSLPWRSGFRMQDPQTYMRDFMIKGVQHVYIN